MNYSSVSKFLISLMFMAVLHVSVSQTNISEVV